MTEASMVILVPSRGRPENAARLAAAVEQLAPEIVVWVGVDDDDPEALRYRELAEEGCASGDAPFTVAVLPPNGGGQGMVGALNRMARPAAEQFDIVAFLGDDHLPRTPGFGRRIRRAFEALGGTGLVYCDDRLQGAALPTEVWMSSDIIRVLGWMAPPQLGHLYVDNWWLQLGRGLNRMTYLADVVIEHMHPLAGKAENDQHYARVNAQEVYARDGGAFEELLASGALDRAIGRVKAATGRVA